MKLPLEFPRYGFIRVDAASEAGELADIVYCSNTLEHFENWHDILSRLAQNTKEYVIVVVPF